MSVLRQVLGRTPLGWRQLVHNPIRFLMACAGVAFAVLLIFMQLGFMNMLFETTVMLQRQVDADIVIVNPRARDLINVRTVPRRRVIQALGVDGVRDAESLYISNMSWIKPDSGEKGSVLVLGVRTDFDAFKTPGLRGELSRVAAAGTALFDAVSRGNYRDIVARIQAGEEPRTEVAGRNVTFVGTYRLGATFGVDSGMIVSDQTFFALSPRSDPGTPSLGLVRVAPGFDPEDVARRINVMIDGTDAVAMTMPAFIEVSRNFLIKESPIAFIFSFGVIMGLVVGAVVVFQILASDVQDHLAEYAMLKAVGFSNRTLLSVVYEQATILTIGGFLPGLAAALGGYAIVQRSVTMPMTMPMDRVGLVLALTAGMCLIAGTLALRRVSRVDPAEVFA
ncbi:MAG: ABC transporter permease DevC [Alphaproteobacteria bacterium]